MKKFIALIGLMLSMQSFSALLGETKPLQETSGSKDPDVLALSITSLPTILILDSQIDLSSDEAQERIQAELNGDVEPVLINLIKQQKGE